LFLNQKEKKKGESKRFATIKRGEAIDKEGPINSLANLMEINPSTGRRKNDNRKEAETALSLLGSANGI